MAVEADVIYKDAATHVADMLANMSSRLTDFWVEEDGNGRLLFEVIAGELEGVTLAVQLMRDNMFIQTANLVELRMHGEEVGLKIKAGLAASGTLRFSGTGGTLIPAGSSVVVDPGAGDPLYYETTADGTIPSPGDPTVPTTADGGGSGSLVAGVYEYVVSFVTAEGETLPSPESTALTLAVSHKTNLTAIPIGGPGTVSRKVYRSKNGGTYALVTTIANNTATTFTDNVADGSLPGGAPREESTAERVSIAGESEGAGVTYNTAIGAITELADVPDGVDDVINTTAFSGGADEEDMEKYRGRLLKYIRNPQTGSPEDNESWAEEIDGVEAATAFPNDNAGTPTAGHLTVRIVGPDGSIPGAGVIAAVLAYLQSKNVANMTLHVAVFTAVSTDVSVDVTTDTNVTLGDVTPGVTQAIMECINMTPVGSTVFKAGIIKCVMEVNGVINVTTSFADATATATQKRTPGTIAVT